MANPSSKALYSTCVACLGFVCFAIGATAVGLPLWGYFEDRGGRIIRETGYFGPWQVCKKLSYNREKCGPEANTFEPISLVASDCASGTSMFRRDEYTCIRSKMAGRLFGVLPIGTSVPEGVRVVIVGVFGLTFLFLIFSAVYLAGVVATFGVTFLGVFCVLSVIQMAMVTQRDKVVMRYSRCVAIKLVLAILSTILAIVSAGLFALQTDDRKNNFRISRGESFYIQILLIILDFVLFVMSLYDFLFSRRLGGDPTMSSRDPGGEAATTYNNPHFRDNSSKNHGISMTDASGKPYARSPNYNGSLASMTTMTTTTSNGSSVTRSPLRSSLKKPRPTGDSSLGIHNPGFSQGSPTMQRNGSVKKVRIQTHSTAV